MNIDHHAENDKGVITIVMGDSGNGFDYSKIESELIAKDKKSGRE